MPRRSTGSRNTPARQARLQKLTKGTTDTISSLRGAMGFTPKRPTGSRRTTPTPVATPVATPSNPSRGGRATPAGRATPQIQQKAQQESLLSGLAQAGAINRGSSQQATQAQPMPQAGSATPAQRPQKAQAGAMGPAQNAGMGKPTPPMGMPPSPMGGMAKPMGMKKGGKVGGRGDGAATKGKTKGRMC
jgi:hypothetical protein